MQRVISQEEFLAAHKEHVAWLSNHATGCRMNFTDCNLSCIKMPYANMTGANMTGADLTGANMTGANLTRANLTGANLTGANMTGAYMSHANLTGATMTDANLTRANMSCANMTDAILDFSCWPLWCGSFTVRIDAQIAAQLAYHLLRVWPDAKTDLVSLANSWKGIEKHELKRIEL